MDRLEAVEAHRPQVVTLENVQNLGQRHPAGRRGWHRDEGVAAVLEEDRFTPLRLVAAQILVGDEAAALPHLLDDQVGNTPTVERVLSLAGDQPQRRRQHRLTEVRADASRLTPREEDFGGRLVLREYR